MVNEISKIIYNALLDGEGVFLPGIGSLSVERRKPVRLSGNKIIPAIRQVVYTEHENGVSLIDEIARIGETDEERAAMLYSEWRSASYADGTLKIESVGTLTDETFTIDESLNSLLNPHGTKPVKIKSHGDTVLYIFAVICCLIAGCVVGYIIFSSIEKDRPVVTEPAVRTVAEAAVPDEPEAEPAIREPVKEAVAEQTETAAVRTEEPAKPVAKPAPAADSNAVRHTVSGNNYLVLGVFSIEENARKAIAAAKKKMPDVDCRIYYYSDKYMVSIFDSTSLKDCEIYKSLTDHIFPDVWIYTKK